MTVQILENGWDKYLKVSKLKFIQKFIPIPPRDIFGANEQFEVSLWDKIAGFVRLQTSFAVTKVHKMYIFTLENCKKWKPTILDENGKALEKKKTNCNRRCVTTGKLSIIPVTCNCDKQRNCSYQIKVRGTPGSKRKGWFSWDHTDENGSR